MATLVFVHGACVRDEVWWWSRMTGPLSAHGIASVAVELPSCAEVRGDLYADVDATVRAIESADPPIALLGHSYGGMVITEAGDHPWVEQLFYLASVMPDQSESLSSFGGDSPAPWLDTSDDGTVGVRPDMVRDLFLHDCDEAAVEGALARLARQSLAAFSEPPRAVAWRRKPASYIVCADDRAIPAELQRSRGARAGRIVELATGHHPFLSRPELLTDVLVDAVG
jgi:pimeloyl-ACP methyl ester carboxylesterase